MRVLVYVPPETRGADRLRRRIKREVEEHGYNFMGYVSSPAQAHAALFAELADKIAGRPEHLVELADWALPLDPRRRPGAAVTAAALAGLAWMVSQIRRHPAMTGATVAAAGLLAAALLLGPVPEPDDDGPAQPPVAGPPPLTPAPLAPIQPTKILSPTPGLPTPESPPAEPESGPSPIAPNDDEGPDSPGGSGGELPEPEPEPKPEPEPEPEPEPTNPESTPEPSPTGEPASPPTEEDDDEESCLLELEAVGVTLRVCPPPLSG